MGARPPMASQAWSDTHAIKFATGRVQHSQPNL